ncbi:MAG: SAM-dependent methyltransferase, partial [bacterium]|nr:SAM-dependent methyltransferase [bacterium]
AEGSIFIVGFEKGLNQWRKYLSPGGFIALTDVFLFKPNLPEELKTFWEQVDPGIINLEEALRVIEKSGYSRIDHFQLPEVAWWDDCYRPLEEQLKVFGEKYMDDPEALRVIEALQKEIDMYRKYSDYYGYIFFILKKKE